MGSGILAVMMFLTATDVILRYFFDSPVKGAYELQSFMMVIVIALALSYTAMKKSHITVDIVLMRLPVRVRAVFDSVTALIGLALFVLVVWQSFKYVSTLAASNTLATTLPIPWYPFAAVLALGMVVFFIVMLRDLFAKLAEAIGGER